MDLRRYFCHVGWRCYSGRGSPHAVFRKSGVGDPTFGRDTRDLHPVFVAVSGAPPAGERHGTPI